MSNPKELNTPVQAQHDQPIDDKIRGILQQEEADLAGHEKHVIEKALRQRFADSGITLSDEIVDSAAERISGLGSTSYSESGKPAPAVYPPQRPILARPRRIKP